MRMSQPFPFVTGRRRSLSSQSCQKCLEGQLRPPRRRTERHACGVRLPFRQYSCARCRQRRSRHHDNREDRPRRRISDPRAPSPVGLERQWSRFEFAAGSSGDNMTARRLLDDAESEADLLHFTALSKPSANRAFPGSLARLCDRGSSATRNENPVDLFWGTSHWNLPPTVASWRCRRGEFRCTNRRSVSSSARVRKSHFLHAVESTRRKTNARLLTSPSAVNWINLRRANRHLHDRCRA